jgi:hypothetical protein
VSDLLKVGDTILSIDRWRHGIPPRAVEIVKVSRAHYTMANGHKVPIHGTPRRPQGERRIEHKGYEHVYWMTLEDMQAERVRQDAIFWMRGVQLSADEAVACKALVEKMRGVSHG